jgi:hypothetical protein
LKLVSLFFLFAIILIASVAASANSAHGKTSAKDTIIKLDSVRDRKLLKLKKPVKGAKNDNA